MMKEFEYTGRIMGTDLFVSLVADAESEVGPVFEVILARLSLLESQFSRFLEDSELSVLNEKKHLHVSPLFLDVLLKARLLFEKTRGYFNPLLQIERFGYTQSFEKMQNQTVPTKQTAYSTDMESVMIDVSTCTVTLGPDQKLDFGGFLKGYAAELEAKRVKQEFPEIQGIIVNIGGDLYTLGTDSEGKPFVFEIENPVNKQTVSIRVQDAALATSGTYRRRWGTQENMHHILAPSGLENPVTNVVSASIVHTDGATAEAYTKALISLSPQVLEGMIGEKLRYVIIHTDGAIEMA